MSKTLHWMARYSAIEIVLYNLVLTIHQIALASVLGCTCFGFIGILFSIVYMAVASAMSGIYQQLIQQDRLQYPLRDILVVQAGIITLVLLCTGLAIYLMNYTTYIVVMLVVLTESCHKTAKLILYREQQHNIVAFAELAALVIYIASIWGYYATVGYINTPIILGNWALVGLAINAWYWMLVTKNLSKLPRAYPSSNNVLIACLQQRLAFAGVTIALTSVNSNSITIGLGKIFGPASITYLKLARQYTAMISSLVDHIAGINVGILLHKASQETISIQLIQRFVWLAAGCSVLLVLSAIGLVHLNCNLSLWQEIIPALALVLMIAIDQYMTPALHIAYATNIWRKYIIIPTGQIVVGALLYWHGASFLLLMLGVAIAKVVGIIVVLYVFKS